MVERKPFFQHLNLSDSSLVTTSADLDEECVDIMQVWHDMPLGQDDTGEVIIGDQPDHIRLSAADMDALALAWLRCRLNDVDTKNQEQQEGG